MVNAGGNSNKKVINTRTLQIYKYTLLWHSHCTVRVAEDEVAVSRLLLATHLYCPASDCWTFDMFNWWSPSLEDTLSRTSPVTFNSSPFFVHATSGVGYPATTQLKSTVCFSSFVRLVGGLEISGPTSNVKIKNWKTESLQNHTYFTKYSKNCHFGNFCWNTTTLQHWFKWKLLRLITVKKQQTLKGIE